MGKVKHSSRYHASSSSSSSSKKKVSTDAALRERLIDPAVIGPGWWMLYFMRAIDAGVNNWPLERKLQMIADVENDSRFFPCDACRTDFADMMMELKDTNRYDYYINPRNHIFPTRDGPIEGGMFMMFFEMKNKVRARQGKSLATQQEMFAMYYDIYKNGCRDSPVCKA